MRFRLTIIAFVVICTPCLMAGGLDEKEIAEVTKPEDITGPVPKGVPPTEGKLYRVTGLRGLIPYGDEVLVQVSPEMSEAYKTWQQHERNVQTFLESTDRQKLVEPSAAHRFLKLVEPGENKDYVFYYLEPGEPLLLRAMCVGLFSFDRPNTPCYFTYHINNGIVQFTLDKEAVVGGKFEEIEDIIFKALEKAETPPLNEQR